MPETKLSVEQLIFRLLVARAKNDTNGYTAGARRRVVLDYIKGKNAVVKTDRALRRRVRIMQRTGYRIGSHAKYGYFVLKTEKDLALSIEERAKKIKALGKSICWDKRAFQNLSQRKLSMVVV